MKVLLFQPRFAEMVKSGLKRQTIRPRRKQPIKVEDRLSLRTWSGLPYRSKQIILLPDEVHICNRVARVLITLVDGAVMLSVGGHLLYGTFLEAFARADGFKNVEEFGLFFLSGEHKGAFDGDLICW